MCYVFWKCHSFGRTDGDQIAEADRYMVRFVSNSIYHIPSPSLLIYLIANLLPPPSPLTAHPKISYCTYHLGTLRDKGPHFLAILAQVRIHTYIDSLPSPPLPSPTQRYLPLSTYLPTSLPPSYQPTNQPTYLTPARHPFFPSIHSSIIHFFPFLPYQTSVAKRSKSLSLSSPLLSSPLLSSLLPSFPPFLIFTSPYPPFLLPSFPPFFTFPPSPYPPSPIPPFFPLLPSLSFHPPSIFPHFSRAGGSGEKG